MSESAPASVSPEPQPKAKRRGGRGQKPMVWAGGLILLGLVIVNEYRPVPAGQARGDVWPLLLALAASIYLWWLGSVLFDLMFIWQRYIQGDAAHKFMRHHVQRKSFVPTESSGSEDKDEEDDLGLGAKVKPVAPGGGPEAKRPEVEVLIAKTDKLLAALEVEQSQWPGTLKDEPNPKFKDVPGILRKKRRDIELGSFEPGSSGVKPPAPQEFEER